MSFDWIKDPVSDDAPAGPDLEATDDDRFLDYYYEAESRMPERYFTPGIQEKGQDYIPGTLFDPRTIKADAEKATITDLLKRSRDLRLLSLLARMMILAGRLPDFAAALEAAADVMEAFPGEVHPRAVSDRRGALDELGNSGLVVIPLQYAELAGAGEASLRRLQVANGNSDPREGEVGLSAAKMLSEIAAPANRKAVEAAHDALTRAAAALARIKSACLRDEQSPFNPAVEPTETALKEAMALIAQGRPDLQPWSAEAAAAAAEEAAAPEEDAAEDATGDTPAPVTALAAAAPTVVTDIPNRTAARQTLAAIEGYFATHEPAAPAMLLITQARLLVGKPLVEAIETLMPAQAAQTQIDFGPETGFLLDMERLRMLSNEAANAAAPAAEEDPGAAPVVTSRADVTGHLTALEQFFRAREPASPIPVLLFRARTYLEKDFAAIVAEMIPPPAQE